MTQSPIQLKKQGNERSSEYESWGDGRLNKVRKMGFLRNIGGGEVNFYFSS